LWFKGLQQLLEDSDDDALKRQVRGVLDAVGAMKDPRNQQPRVNTATAGRTHTYMYSHAVFERL